MSAPGVAHERALRARRRPVPPAPLERYEIAQPAVPDELEGLSILQISDPHIRRPQGGDSPLLRAARAASERPVDLLLLTGDVMHRPGHERAAMSLLEQALEAADPRLGAFGVFGNHDSARFREMARGLPGILWLEDEPIDLLGGSLRLLGASWLEDVLTPVLTGAELDRFTADFGGGTPTGPQRFQIVLAHDPATVYAAAAAGIPLVLSGHTHGGQMRIGPQMLLHTSCDLPRHRASGVLRYRQTLCVVSRGLGETIVPIRLRCPPQAPLLVLRRGEMPARRAADAGGLEQVVAW